MPKTFLHYLKSLTEHNLKLNYWPYTSNSMTNDNKVAFYQQAECSFHSMHIKNGLSTKRIDGISSFM